MRKPHFSELRSAQHQPQNDKPIPENEYGVLAPSGAQTVAPRLHRTERETHAPTRTSTQCMLYMCVHVRKGECRRTMARVWPVRKHTLQHSWSL